MWPPESVRRSTAVAGVIYGMRKLFKIPTYASGRAGSATDVSQAHPAYRPDIDGLRAVAVLSVVYFHAFPAHGRGGFIGVDMFFVISGFLISSILFQSVLDGRFTYADFYSRRIRRIFPALVVVLLTCAILAALFTWPYDTWMLGKHMVAAAGFVSNLVLSSEAGYFDGRSDTKPLLHLWSLGVEEQYYIFWPIIVSLFLRRRRQFIVCLALLLVASFSLNVFFVAKDPSEVFYSPVTRAWELLIGSVLVLASKDVRPRGNWGLWVNGLAATGLAFLLAGFWWTTSSGFPGWWALLPTIGTALLIFSGPTAWINRVILGHPAAVFIGKISYPLYLWHWPLLVYPLLIGSQPYLSRDSRLLAVAIAGLLAWITYRYIEQPIRHRPTLFLRTQYTLALAMITLAGVGAGFVVSNGWINRVPPSIREIAGTEARYQRLHEAAIPCVLEPQARSINTSRECIQENFPDAKRVWIWGDSHAGSLAMGLKEIATERGFGFRELTASACPPVLDYFVSERPNCKHINDQTFDLIARLRPEVVILSAAWTLYAGGEFELLDKTQIRMTVNRLHDVGITHVVVMGPLIRWSRPEPRIILDLWDISGEIPRKSVTLLDPRLFSVDREIRSAIDGTPAHYVSPVAELCASGECQMTVDWNGKVLPISWDDAHLTWEGSKVLTRKLADVILP